MFGMLIMLEHINKNNLKNIVVKYLKKLLMISIVCKKSCMQTLGQSHFN